MTKTNLEKGGGILEHLYGLSNGVKHNYRGLFVAELSFDKEKVPRAF